MSSCLKHSTTHSLPCNVGKKKKKKNEHTCLSKYNKQEKSCLHFPLAYLASLQILQTVRLPWGKTFLNDSNPRQFPGEKRTKLSPLTLV